MNGPGSIRIVERGPRASSFGEVMQLKVWADGYPDLRWEDIQAAFNEKYPGRWAIQLFPPKETIVNGKACYHLWILRDPPQGIDLREAEGGFPW